MQGAPVYHAEGADCWRCRQTRSSRFDPAQGTAEVEFLKALTATIQGKLLIIWDGLAAHRSRVVRNYV
jgi:hypothetical protein